MTHCPFFTGHRRVPVDGLVVHMEAGSVDLLDTINVLWQNAPTHAAIVAAFYQVDAKRRPWTKWVCRDVARYMIYSGELAKYLKIVCRRAGLPRECSRVLASDAMAELMGRAADNKTDTRIDRVKAAVDTACGLLEDLPDGAFATAYPAYKYAAAAIISTKRRRIE